MNYKRNMKYSHFIRKLRQDIIGLYKETSLNICKSKLTKNRYTFDETNSKEQPNKKK